jgi:hypothetical protein
LQAALAQTLVAHWAFAEHVAHLPITQRPLAQAPSAPHSAPTLARQSSVEQSRQMCATGSQVGVEVPSHTASFVQGTVRITPLAVVIAGPVVVVVDAGGEPPAPSLPHWRRSVQGSGANRHPGAPADSASARRAATRAPRRALGEGIAEVVAVRRGRVNRAGETR